jgi:hypothetical protein
MLDHMRVAASGHPPDRSSADSIARQAALANALCPGARERFQHEPSPETQESPTHSCRKSRASRSMFVRIHSLGVNRPVCFFPQRLGSHLRNVQSLAPDRSPEPLAMRSFGFMVYLEQRAQISCKSGNIALCHWSPEEAATMCRGSS